MSRRKEPTTDLDCELILQPPGGESPKSSAKGALLILVVMFGWLMLIYGAAAVVARNDPNIELPIAVSRGVVVTPADGWYSAADEWDVGETGVALQKSGVYVAFWVDEFRGTNEDLLTMVLEELRPSFESFRNLPVGPVTVAKDLPGLTVRFSGLTDWGYEENQLVVLSHAGTSVVMLAETLKGQLSWVQGDIDTMLANIKVPQ